MTTQEYFAFLKDEIHSVVAATTDSDSRPVTCVIDIMDSDENGLYFLTARGKGFYNRLVSSGYIALTGFKGKDTMSCIALSVKGKVRNVGRDRLARLFALNPYMAEIYPTEESIAALTVFQLYEGTGEWFDLSKKPIERDNFSFGKAILEEKGYFIQGNCTGCRKCASVCPQSCIDIADSIAIIRQENCLHCGNCFEICPAMAIIKKD